LIVTRPTHIDKYLPTSSVVCPFRCQFSFEVALLSLVFPERFWKDSNIQWKKRARGVQDGKFLTESGLTAGIDAGFAFITDTYVAPEDRQAHPETQKIRAHGDATPIAGYSQEKATRFAHKTASELEYRWHSDLTDDAFVVLPASSGAS